MKNENCYSVIKKIDGIEYRVKVYFSDNNKKKFDDIIEKLVKNDIYNMFDDIA